MTDSPRADSEKVKAEARAQQIRSEVEEACGGKFSPEGAAAVDSVLTDLLPLADAVSERDKYREALGGLVSCLDGEDDDGLGGLTRDSLDALDRARAALSDPQEEGG